VHGLSGDNAGRLQLNSLSLIRLDGTFAIDGVAKGVDDTAEHGGTDWDIDDGTGSLHNISFLDFSKSISKESIPVIAEDDNTNVVGLEVEGHTLDS